MDNRDVNTVAPAKFDFNLFKISPDDVLKYNRQQYVTLLNLGKQPFKDKIAGREIEIDAGKTIQIEIEKAKFLIGDWAWRMRNIPLTDPEIREEERRVTSRYSFHTKKEDRDPDVLIKDEYIPKLIPIKPLVPREYLILGNFMKKEIDTFEKALEQEKAKAE